MMHAIRLFLVLLVGVSAAWSATANTVDFATVDGIYTTNNSITVTVTFSGPVDIVAGTSRLRLALNRIADDAYAVATSSATAVTTANFTYVIRSGDSSADLDYADTTSLTGVTGLTGTLPAIPSGRAVVVSTPLAVTTVTSSPATGTEKKDDVVTITATLNRLVTAAGPSTTLPSLKLATGVSGGRSVSAADVSGVISSFVFTYTVGNTDSTSDLDYLNSGALTLGTRTLDGVTPSLTLPVPGTANSLGINSSLAIDGIIPTLTITAPTTAQKTAPITYSIAASETVSGFTAVTTTNCTATLAGSGTAYTALLTPNSTIKLSAAANAGATTISAENIAILNDGDPIFMNGSVYFITTKTIVVSPNGTLALSSPLPVTLPINTFIFPPAGVDVGIGTALAAANDTAGNGSAMVSDQDIRYDPTPPLPKISAPTTISSGTLAFTVTFTEAVATALSNIGMSVTNGTITTIDGTLNPKFTVTITPTNSTLPVTLTVLAGAVKDAANNNSLAASSTFDTTPPTVTTLTSWITATNPAAWVITFNKPINPTTLTASDFNLSAGVTAGTAAWNTANTQATVPLSFTLSDGATTAQYILSVKAGAVTDATGNVSTDTPSTTVTYDPRTPTLTLTPPTNIQTTTPITINIKASKPVTGLTASDCDVSYGTASSLTDTNGAGTDYTVKLTPSSTMILARAAAVGVSTIRLQMRAASTTEVIPAQTVLLIGSSVVRLTTANSTSIPVTDTGVEVALESPLTSALALGLPVWQAMGTAPTISVRVNTCEDDNHTQNSTAGVSAQTYYDPTPPMFRISAPAKLETNGTAIFTLTPSEPVSNLTGSGLTVTNGTVTSLSEATDHSKWTVIVIPTDATTVALAVNANAAVDSAANPSMAEPAATMTIKPYITKISSANADGTYGAGIHLQVKVTFSEPVTVSGVPSLRLNLTSSGREALYSSTTGNDLVFDYTTVAGDQTGDLDCLGTSLTLNSAIIRDASLGDAVLTLPTTGSAGSLAANAAIVVTDGPTDPGKPGIDDQPLATSGGCGSGSGIALILAGGWLGLGLSRRRRAA